MDSFEEYYTGHFGPVRDNEGLANKLHTRDIWSAALQSPEVRELVGAAKNALTTLDDIGEEAVSQILEDKLRPFIKEEK